MEPAKPPPRANASIKTDIEPACQPSSSVNCSRLVMKLLPFGPVPNPVVCSGKKVPAGLDSRQFVPHFGIGTPERVYTRSPFVYLFMDPPADYATEPRVRVRFTRAVHRSQTAWHKPAMREGQDAVLPASEAAFLIAEGAAEAEA
jgi:hypothetical protein